MEKGILFLDDDEAQHVIYKVFAKKFLGDIPVYFSKTVKEAMEILHANEISLTVLDLMIPIENGADLIMKMKKSSQLDDIKIIVVTSSERDTLIFDALDGMIDEFITKPIKFEDFSNIIAELSN